MKAFRVFRTGFLAGALLFTGALCSFAQYTFTTLDDPLANTNAIGLPGTLISGISGTTMVGVYVDTSLSSHGFIYDGVAWQTVDHPSGRNTMLSGISGTNIAGSYSDENTNAQAFIYNGSDFIPVKFPLALDTTASGISGNSVVGRYSTDGTNYHGFFYDGSTYSTLDYPLSNLKGTYPNGVWGNEVVGYYVDQNSVYHGFIYKTNLWTGLNAPAAASQSGTGTFPMGVSGATVVGFFIDTNYIGHGFLFDGSKFTVVDDPSAFYATHISGISGSSIVGTFRDSVRWHGFLATLPTPPRLSIANAGGVVKISWPYPSTGWILQQNSDLSSTNWMPSSGISNNGTNNLLTVASPTGSLFFRLSQ